MAIVFFGDSYTFGEELNDPRTQSFPALVGDKLKCLTFNQGEPGASNDNICRKIFHFLSKKNQKQVGVVVGLSSPVRFEHFSLQSVYSINPNDHGSSDHKKFARAYFETTCVEWMHQRMLDQVISMQSVLVNCKVPYLMFFTYPIFKVCSKNNYKLNHLSLIDQSRILDYPNSILDRVSHLPFKPKGHPGEAAQEILADVIAERIKEEQWIK